MQTGPREALHRLAGDSRFKPFFDALRRDVYRRARRFFPWCRDADIEDSLQAAFLAVFDAPEKLKLSADELATPALFERKLHAYLKGAATKQLISRLRTLGKESLNLPSLETLREDEARFDQLLYQLGEVEAGPETIAQITRRRLIVEQCLAKLTELARETFMLALSGLKDVEIQLITQAGSAVAVRRRISETKTRVVACVQNAAGETA